MAFVMVTSKWPMASSNDVGKVFLEVWSRPVPDYVKRREVFTAAGADDGLKSYLLMEYEDEHLNEGLLRIGEDLVAFAVVPGYTYNVETLVSPEDALAMLGLKM